MCFERTRVHFTPPDAPLRGRWLVLARAGWFGLVVLTLAIFGASLPLYLAQLQTPCPETACEWQQLTHAQAETLTGIGLSLGDYAAFTVALLLTGMVVCLMVSTLIIWRRPNDRMALFVALLLVPLGPTAVTATAPAASPWLVPDVCVTFLTEALFVLVFLLFPSGQFVPHWTRWILVVLLAVQVFTFFLKFFLQGSYQLHTPVLQSGWLVFLSELVILALVQLYRYRRISSPRERQQTKWVVYGFAVPTTLNVFVSVLALLSPVAVERNALAVLAYNEDGFLFFLIPISFGFAMLHSRLWEIDLIINRTLVYGALTTIVVGVYILVVGILGTLLHTSGDIFFSLLATGLVAMLFQPLRARLQRMINRLMYGERDDPYAVLSRLGSRLEATLAPEAVFPTIVETIAQALKLPYAALALKQGDAFSVTASCGLTQDKLFILPLVYQTETLGQLLLAPRTPGDAFTAADRRLLEVIARQAGAAVHAMRLTVDLQHSREHLVMTREEERRRLRRDLHDGLGPTLASMTLKLDAARLLLTQNPSGVGPLLVELKAQMQATIVDIRRLVYDLRPPALDEFGLLSALREQASHSSQLSGVHISIEMPERLPCLSAAVEVAVYRIVSEALTNVARHAQARSCCIRLDVADVLSLEVRDDGIGLPGNHRAGVGISSMRERAAELGGTCVIEAGVTGGTRVLVHLPLAKE